MGTNKMEPFSFQKKKNSRIRKGHQEMQATKRERDMLKSHSCTANAQHQERTVIP
jgi:hypothetical protein